MYKDRTAFLQLKKLLKWTETSIMCRHTCNPLCILNPAYQSCWFRCSSSACHSLLPRSINKKIYFFYDIDKKKCYIAAAVASQETSRFTVHQQASLICRPVLSVRLNGYEHFSQRQTACINYLSSLSWFKLTHSCTIRVCLWKHN